MDAIKTDKGCEHLCGHDGHITIMLGLAQRLAENRNFSGTVFLLFQPAEEIGEGAALMIKDIDKLGLKFDYAFALHNNPNYELNEVIIHKGTYAAGSTGMELHFNGKASHAAFPEQAVSPVNAIFATINEIRRLNEDKTQFNDFTLTTVVNVEIGEANYGVTPGDGFLRLTLRSFDDADLNKLCGIIDNFASERAKKDGLKLTVTYHDRFPATINNSVANKMVEEAAKATGHSILYVTDPTRGSDDFCYFTNGAKASFFDIGNGKESSDLHQPDYHFSDEIIIPSINIFYDLVFKM